MATVCPTITTADPHEYREQIELLSSFAPRVHIDLMDGDLAPSRSINPVQLYWPKDLVVDIHLMYRRPTDHIETLVSLKPSLVILHAEADGDIVGMIQHLHKFGIRTGLALLPRTSVADVRDLIEHVDHVLVFGGHLGYQGGTADLDQLHKVAEIEMVRPGIEIAWDGGANGENIKQIVAAGVGVVNVGAAIKEASSPQNAYEELAAQLA